MPNKNVGPFVLASSLAGGQERWLVYFSLFLDESGKSAKGDFTSLCGYVSTMDEWGRFQYTWDHLRFKHNIPPIHMARIMYPASKNDEWKKKYEQIVAGGVEWKDWYAPLLTEFAQLVSQASIVCVGSVVEAWAYRELQKEAPEDFLLANGDSNVFLLQYAVMAALDRIDAVDRTGLLTINIDDDREHAFEYYKSYWNLQTMVDNPRLPDAMKPRFERISNRVDQIGFCNDRFHAALQAADMIAYLSRDYKVKEMQGKPTENQELWETLFAHLTRGGTQQPKIYPESILRELANRTATSIRKARDEENCAGI